MMINIDNTCRGAQCLSGAVWTQGTESSDTGHPENYANVKTQCERWGNLHKANEPCVHVMQEQCQEPNTRPWSLDPMSTFTSLRLSDDWNLQKGTKEQAETIPLALTTKREQSAQKLHCLCTASSQASGPAAYKHSLSWKIPLNFAIFNIHI